MISIINFILASDRLVKLADELIKLYYEQRIIKINKEYDDKQKKIVALYSQISKANSDAERQVLVCILNDYRNK